MESPGPTGVLYGLDSATNYLHRINRLTGESTPVGFMGVDVVEGDIAFNPIDGLLYGTQSNGGDRLYTINTQTGHATIIGTIIQNGDISGMAFGPDGTLYCFDTQNAQVYTVDPTSGQILTSISLVGDILPTSNISTAGLSVDPDTGRLYMVSDFFLPTGVNPLYWITTSNGFLRSVGNQGTGLPQGTQLSGLAFVPEPSSLALICVGSITLLTRRRRR
ncbi:MAG: PEP-CTERM sorting domain-containing protein [Planctomycetes bacterium]|nr:PEP-CTERM sorting domain-containing protein [Planctomycetota bacterium]